MKLSPRTSSLALLLAAGVAVPALAQTTTSPQAASPAAPTMSQGGGWNAAHPQSSYATEQQQQPQAGLAPPQANSAQPQANSAQPQAAGSPASANREMAPNYAQTHAPQNQQVQQAQTALNAAGLYTGPQDGLMDPDTRAALARFQEQHGLPRSGRLDPRTTAALMSNQTTAGSGSSAPSTTPVAPNAAQGEGQTLPPPSGAGGNTQVQPGR